MSKKGGSKLKLRLRELRQQKGITQTFMAEKLGFKYVSGYNAIELGRNKLSAERAKQIAEILGVDMNDLFFDEKLPEMCNSPNTA